MRHIERSNALKIALIVLLMSAALTIPANFLVQCAKGLIIDELNKNALNIAATAACFIERDIDAYGDRPSDGTGSVDLSDEYYQSLLDRLDHIRTESGAKRVFIEKRTEDRGRAVVLDGYSRQQRSGPAVPPDERGRDMSAVERRAFDEGIMLASGLLRDSFRGEYITGYAPIIEGKTGLPICIVGVEFPLSYSQSIITGFGSIIWSVFIVIMLLGSLLVFSLIKSRMKFSTEDSMTGLFNKRYLERDLARLLRYVKRKRRKLSLIMADVDCFKSINDTLGHTTGDAVLKSVAKHMRNFVRSSDLCFRYGGDEFVITLVNTGKEKAYEIAERIRSELKNAGLKTADGHPIAVSLSMGIAEYGGDESIREFIDRADGALYVSKNTGKDKTSVYGEGEAA